MDRDGDLFKHVLAYMRTGRRPAREVLWWEKSHPDWAVGS